MLKYFVLPALLFALSSMQVSLFAQGDYTVSNPCLDHSKLELITA